MTRLAQSKTVLRGSAFHLRVSGPLRRQNDLASIRERRPMRTKTLPCVSVEFATLRQWLLSGRLSNSALPFEIAPIWPNTQATPSLSVGNPLLSFFGSQCNCLSRFHKLPRDFIASACISTGPPSTQTGRGTCRDNRKITKVQGAICFPTLPVQTSAETHR